MSEINSIAQGTYTLGQTSATTYQAGPGISITQPSEGTVRISNDETVLWSGSYESTGSITLSESFKNFELIRVEFVTNDNISFTSVFNSAEQNNDFILFGSYVRSTVTGISIKASQYTFTNTTTTITLVRGYEVAIGQSATQSSGNKITIKRIVGINRISGSNA